MSSSERAHRDLARERLPRAPRSPSRTASRDLDVQGDRRRVRVLEHHLVVGAARQHLGHQVAERWANISLPDAFSTTRWELDVVDEVRL